MSVNHNSNAQVCLNGHVVTAWAETPNRGSKFCSICGEPTIRHCSDIEKCNAPIRGKLCEGSLTPVVEDLKKPPNYCHECGIPYPWTERRAEALADAIDELEELQETERDKLKQSIPDVLSETPKTETATRRFGKAIANMGAASGKLLKVVLANVAAEVVCRQLGLK